MEQMIRDTFGTLYFSPTRQRVKIKRDICPRRLNSANSSMLVGWWISVHKNPLGELKPLERWDQRTEVVVSSKLPRRVHIQPVRPVDPGAERHCW